MLCMYVMYVCYVCHICHVCHICDIWGVGGEDSFSLVFENSIVLIKCTLYDTVFQR